MITIENQCFSIPQICESGQCFRLDPVGNNRYRLQAADRFLLIEAGTDRTVLHCTDQEYEVFWKSYFDLDTCYEDYLKRIPEEDAYLKHAARFGRGIRILRQDLWEMLITFILSQQNNIPRIKGMIQSLSMGYGSPRETPEGEVYYTFPDAISLASASEKELRALKLGYRSKYICGTAKMAAAREVDLTALHDLDYMQAREALMKFPGVGAKVADCICLFGLHHMDAFPVDTHIRKVLDIHYPKGFPFERYSGCAGVMQQYIFYYDLKGETK